MGLTRHDGVPATRSDDEGNSGIAPETDPKNYSFGIGKTEGASILRTLPRPEPRKSQLWLDRMPGPLGWARLPDGVTVARVTLNHLVQVQILVGQLFSITL